MDVATAVQQLLQVCLHRCNVHEGNHLYYLFQVEQRRGDGAYSPSTLAIGVARIGADDQRMIAAPLCDLKDVDFGPPLHSLVLPGDMHPLELTMVQRLQVA